MCETTVPIATVIEDNRQIMGMSPPFCLDTLREVLSVTGHKISCIEKSYFTECQEHADVRDKTGKLVCTITLDYATWNGTTILTVRMGWSGL